MEQIEMTFSASLFQAQLGAIAAANIAKAFYQVVAGEESEVGRRFADAVELAVGEACTNSVKYCPPTQTASNKVLLLFEFTEDELIIRIRDCNAPFDFKGVQEPHFADFPEQGYGIHIMKKSMNRVKYEHKGGWNIITMQKKIPEET